MVTNRTLASKVDAVSAAVHELAKELTGLRMTLDELKVQVAASVSVETSAVVLIQGLAEKLAAAATDPAAVQALAESLKQSAGALAAAVAAGTQVSTPSAEATVAVPLVEVAPVQAEAPQAPQEPTTTTPS